jgi:ADP-dependent NAD(P)H-hydrate dehydratase / NAD(P)H-hydrate epimerase
MIGTPILNATEMRTAEERVIAGGTPVDVLMERAGTAVAEVAWRIAGRASTLVVCGHGNNGGDGYVAARLLRERGVPVTVAALREPVTPAARAAAARWAGQTITLDQAAPATVVIDAGFGTGLTRALDPESASRLCRLVAAARSSIAVDLPSGISSDDGRVLGEVPRVDLTLALGALKPAHCLLPAAEQCAQVVLADIGVDMVESALVRIERPSIAAPTPHNHKYSRGKVLVIGGAMPGAAALCALAAQRSGAGYVELAGTDTGAAPHALVRREGFSRALDDGRIGAVAIGPGLGRGRSARDRVEEAIGSGHKLVLDADALGIVGGSLRQRVAGHVLTPHWGEFVRLFGDDGRDRLTQARAAARNSGAVVLLKGADSIVAHPDGRAAIASLAPSWLASAGTGDVLAGIAGAMLARGLDPFAAAQAALWLHAEAARRAGPVLIADDLVAQLPGAVAACL